MDLVKACDRLDWCYLRLILIQTSLSYEVMEWIMGCTITSSRFVVLINGSPSCFFSGNRGLQQGCPVSPYLFILAIVGLNLLIHNGIALNDIVGVKVAGIVIISHLFYVDDVLVFGHGSVMEWQDYKDIINMFCKESSLEISSKKPCFIYAGVDDDTRK